MQEEQNIGNALERRRHVQDHQEFTRQTRSGRTRQPERGKRMNRCQRGMKVSKRSLFGKSSVGELEDQAGQDVMRPSPQERTSYLKVTFTLPLQLNKIRTKSYLSIAILHSGTVVLDVTFTGFIQIWFQTDVLCLQECEPAWKSDLTLSWRGQTQTLHTYLLIRLSCLNFYAKWQQCGHCSKRTEFQFCH